MKREGFFNTGLQCIIEHAWTALPSGAATFQLTVLPSGAATFQLTFLPSGAAIFQLTVLPSGAATLVECPATNKKGRMVSYFVLNNSQRLYL